MGTMPVMAAEQPELPTKVQDIANGSDNIYGEGVPIEHGTNPDERFSSGGVDHTHQYIIANALTILSNDQGNSTFNGELNSSILMEATDWPDKLGNETDKGTSGRMMEVPLSVNGVLFFMVRLYTCPYISSDRSCGCKRDTRNPLWYPGMENCRDQSLPRSSRFPRHHSSQADV